jgi:hypothetical protein
VEPVVLLYRRVVVRVPAEERLAVKTTLAPVAVKPVRWPLPEYPPTEVLTAGPDE